MTEAGVPATGPKDDLRAMRILCFALMVGVVVFAIIVAVLNQGNALPTKEMGKQLNDILPYVVAGIAVLCYLVARSSYSKKVAVIKNLQTSLGNKLNQYRTVLITYMAPCEGAALFSVMGLFLTGNYYFLIITSVMLAAMYSKMPSKERLTKELDLDWKEQQEL
ncbi:MAG: hypothetical protein ABL876_14645 [Chitinophagaceae bacterium]